MTTADHGRATAIDASGITGETVDLDQLIRELDAAYDRFPEHALRACQQRRDLVTPRLIDVLQEAARVGCEGSIREGNAPLFALMLLAEFQATEALPAIMAVLELPNDVPDRLLGDAVTEEVPRILASLAANQIEAIDSLLANRQTYEYVRWSAAAAHKYLVRDGRMSRKEAVTGLTDFLRQAIESADVAVITPLVLVLADLNANESLADIKRAFEMRLVDESMTDLRSLLEEFRPDQPDVCPELGRLGPTNIEDTVEELRGWHWPCEQPAFTREDPLAANIWPFSSENRDDNGPLPASLELDYDDSYPPATIRHDTSRIGRNDPCPCGSGKKYKKCCLRA
jgi:uncharacterized protein